MKVAAWPARILRRRFTTREYHRMAEVGILGADERVELLDGEIILKDSIRPPHAACVSRMSAVLLPRLRKRATVRVRGPIVLGRYSEPEPDISVLVHRPDFYAEAHPRPREVLLVVEILVASAVDRRCKLPLYARAEIREVWLVDPEAKTVEVHREPALRGYRAHETFSRHQAITPLAFPRLRFRMNELLG